MSDQVIVYSPKYAVDIGEHVFPTSKYRLLEDFLMEEAGLKPEDFEDFIEPKPAHDEDIIQRCKRHLANYKVPHIVRFLNELPKTPTGKVLKEELRKNL